MLGGAAVRAQTQSSTDLSELKREIQALRDGQEVLREALDEIKTLIEEREPTAWPALEHYVESGQVKHVFLDSPIESLHPLAPRAHEAARCAGDQARYWEMYAVLFAYQDEQSLDDLVEHAKDLDLDLDAFLECLDDEKHAEVVGRGVAQGERLGVSATPTFLLGRTDPASDELSASQALVGAKPVAGFEAVIDELLEARE